MVKKNVKKKPAKKQAKKPVKKQAKKATKKVSVKKVPEVLKEEPPELVVEMPVCPSCSERENIATSMAFVGENLTSKDYHCNRCGKNFNFPK